MNAKRYVVAVWSALALVPAGPKLSAAPVVFFFSGQITERRATNSVFTEPDTDQFYGYFSYDTTATVIGRNLYPLLSFSVDGNSLNFTNSTLVPAYGIPGILINNGRFGGSDDVQIQGFYPPASTGFYDKGSITISFIDQTGQVFTNNDLPTSLSLSSFDSARLGPSTIGIRPTGMTYDQGTITQLIQVPEPAAWGFLGLGLLFTGCARRRFLPAQRNELTPRWRTASVRVGR